MARYGISIYGQDYYGEGDTPPSDPPEGRVAWIFDDGETEYELPINPNSASVPAMSRNIVKKSTCAGRQVIYEGRKNVEEINISGDILTEAQFRAFQTWVSKRKQVRVTDDLGRKFWVYFKNFSPTRVKNLDYPWHHTYSISGFVLDRGAYQPQAS